MFVTHTKRQLGDQNYKLATQFAKTGTLALPQPLAEATGKCNTLKPSPPARGKPKAQPMKPTTLFRKYYLRGDFPVAISFSGAQRTLKWTADPKTIDLAVFLPLFLEGLTETEEPFAFIAEKTSQQAIAANPDKLAEVLPELILPLKRALDSRDPLIVVRAIKVLQAMLAAKSGLAEDLVPYYKNLLPAFNKHITKNPNLGHQIEFSQKDGRNLGDLVIDTLNVLEQNGSPEAFAHIKYMIPVYQSAKPK